MRQRSSAAPRAPDTGGAPRTLSLPPSSAPPQVVDLDTIDVSNLNRQFLFRPEHVGRSKAEVAAHAVAQLAPDVKIVPHFGNVRDARFGVTFVRGFTVVVNALDNMEVRATRPPRATHADTRPSEDTHTHNTHTPYMPRRPRPFFLYFFSSAVGRRAGT